MNYMKAYEWIAVYQESEHKLEHEVYSLSKWHESGTHVSYPHWVVEQIQTEPEGKEAA